MSHSAQLLFQKHKPKWRQNRGGMFCCYVRMGNVYESLCGRAWPKGKLIGATCDRPRCLLRCAQCDLGEIRLGNADESYPESPENRPKAQKSEPADCTTDVYPADIESWVTGTEAK